MKNATAQKSTVRLLDSQPTAPKVGLLWDQEKFEADRRTLLMAWFEVSRIFAIAHSNSHIRTEINRLVKVLDELDSGERAERKQFGFDLERLNILGRSLPSVTYGCIGEFFESRPRRA